MQPLTLASSWDSLQWGQVVSSVSASARVLAGPGDVGGMGLDVTSLIAQY
jgi:hypothetical protein